MLTYWFMIGCLVAPLWFMSGNVKHRNEFTGAGYLIGTAMVIIFWPIFLYRML
jgi:hypothetical protein